MLTVLKKDSHLTADTRKRDVSSAVAGHHLYTGAEAQLPALTSEEECEGEKNKFSRRKLMKTNEAKKGKFEAVITKRNNYRSSTKCTGDGNQDDHT